MHKFDFLRLTCFMQAVIISGNLSVWRSYWSFIPLKYSKEQHSMVLLDRVLFHAPTTEKTLQEAYATGLKALFKFLDEQKYDLIAPDTTVPEVFKEHVHLYNSTSDTLAV